MAEKCETDIGGEVCLVREVCLGREVCLVRGKNGKYLGYTKDILVENLSQRESTIFVCIRCQGLMREVCLSSGGEQFCSSCKKVGEQTHPNIQMDNMILSIKCSCPLIAKGCKWLGVIGGCQNHLDTCGYVYETCKLRCGVVLQRNELSVHEMEKCPQRLVECERCNEYFKFYDDSAHLDVCPKMEVSCELKCGVVMCREVMTQHFKQECGLMVEMCKLGCGVKLTRNELRIHVTDTCVQRMIQCQHCKGALKCCNMYTHLAKCPKIEMSCEFNCGVVMCRRFMTQHLREGCPEEGIECPYAKYKCVGLIKRKDMSEHLEERKMEHLELKLTDIIFKQSVTIEIMSKRIESLEKEVININSIPTKLEWITKLPERYCHIKKLFVVAGYQFEFDFNYHYFYPLQIIICPQNGFYYENLKWPFKAEFRTRLISKRNPTVTKEFKSVMIVVERKDFNSDSKKYFNIVTITRNESTEIAYNYCTDGVADFEIFVVFL